MAFDVGETIICSVEIKDSAGAYKDPNNDYTHMQISITQSTPSFKSIVDWTIMTRDDVGKYHYDFQSAGYSVGKYVVSYKATDSTRITIETEDLELK